MGQAQFSQKTNLSKKRNPKLLTFDIAARRTYHNIDPWRVWSRWRPWEATMQRRHWFCAQLSASVTETNIFDCLGRTTVVQGGWCEWNEGDPRSTTLVRFGPWKPIVIILGIGVHSIKLHVSLKDKDNLIYVFTYLASFFVN